MKRTLIGAVVAICLLVAIYYLAMNLKVERPTNNLPPAPERVFSDNF